MLAGIRIAAALALAVVFVLAARAKLVDRPGTAAEFESLGLPGPAALATAVPVVEIVLAVLLTLVPGWGGVGAFALLAAFTTVLASVVRSGRVVTCACFGGGSSEPVSARHLVRNAGLMVLAGLAASSSGPVWDLVG